MKNIFKTYIILSSFFVLLISCKKDANIIENSTLPHLNGKIKLVTEKVTSRINLYEIINHTSYDEKGNKVEEKSYRYDYDLQGNIIKPGTLIKLIKYTYDISDKLIEQKIYDMLGPGINYDENQYKRFTYKYDINGNVIEKKNYRRYSTYKILSTGEFDGNYEVEDSCKSYTIEYFK